MNFDRWFLKISMENEEFYNGIFTLPKSNQSKTADQTETIIRTVKQIKPGTSLKSAKGS